MGAEGCDTICSYFTRYLSCPLKDYCNIRKFEKSIYKLILPAQKDYFTRKGLGNEVVFGNLQSFNFTSLTSNCIGALSETSSAESGYTEVRIRGRHSWTLFQLLRQANVTSRVHFECTSFPPPYQQ